MATTNNTKINRKPMTEEQKKANAERMKKAREAKKAQEAAEKETETRAENSAPAAQSFTADDVQKMIAEALAKQQEAFDKQQEEFAKQIAQMQAPQVIQYTGDSEKVIMRFQAEVADDNVAEFGQGGMFGKVTGKRGTIQIPKSEFSRFYNDQTKWMLEKRWLVVLSGLTDEEREIYGVKYRDGEVLDDMAFAKMLDMTDEEMLKVFPALCDSCREMVARRFRDAYTKRDHRVVGRLNLVRELNRMSKESYNGLPENDNRKKGLFAPLLADMAEEEL